MRHRRTCETLLFLQYFLRFMTKWPTEVIEIASKASPHLVVVRVCISQLDCVLMSPMCRGWSGGAMVLGKLPVPWRPTTFE